MPPSVLISDDYDVVTKALDSKPKFTDPQSIALYNWCFRLLTALFNYVTYFIGDNADRHQFLKQEVDELKEQVEELRTHASLPAPEPLPVKQPNTTKPESSTAKPGRRCQRCHATGHDTTTCRTRDPDAMKKRVSNNAKIKKAANDIYVQRPIPPRLHPYPQYFGDPIIPPQQPLQAYYAAIADAKEFRRRKMQSTKDRRRTNAAATNR
jgi:hypothetical protein